VAVEEIPIQSGEGAGGLAGAKFWVIGAWLAVVRHARDVGTTCGIWFRHHGTAIGVNAHADDIGNHDPFSGIDKYFAHPIEKLLWVGAGNQCQV